MYNKNIGPTGGEALYLDWTNSPLVIKQLLCLKSFFCRFSKKQLETEMINAKV